MGGGGGREMLHLTKYREGKCLGKGDNCPGGNVVDSLNCIFIEHIFLMAMFCNSQ